MHRKFQRAFPVIGATAFLASLVGGGALLVPAAASAAPADDGQKVFAACAMCHGTTAGAKKMGPTLFGVVGRKAGAVPGSNPSPALAKSGKTWTAAELDAFIASPRKALPGTRMPYGGLPDAAKRKALIAYLATLK